MEKKKKKQINLKIDAALDRFVRSRAEAEGTSQIAIYEEALNLYRMRYEIELHIRASIGDNQDLYRTVGDFNAAMLDPDAPPRSWKASLSPVDKDEWIHKETFNALREFDLRGYDMEWLKRAVLAADYYVPIQTVQPPLFPDESATPAQSTPAEPAPARPVRKAKATA